MTNYDKLIEVYKKKLFKALKHLEYSYKKIQNASLDIDKMDEETLEVWESFSARFSRVVDLFLMKYVKSVVLKNDPGFQGSLRDFVDQGEKLGIVNNADTWMELRELRNITAHEYTERELNSFFLKLKQHAPQLLSLKNIFA